MKRCMGCLLLILLCTSHQAFAGGIVRIADGDCAGLRAATAAQATGRTVNIQLATRGIYPYCPFAVTGDVTIDGAGAALQVTPAPDVAGIAIASGARLTIRNLNLAPTPVPIPPNYSNSSCGFGLWPPEITCPTPEQSIFANGGTLLLESVSIVDVDLNYGTLISNGGDFTLRNSSIIHTINGIESLLPIGPTGTTLDVVHSTITGNNTYGLFYADVYPGKGIARVANSIVVSTDGPVCYLPGPTDEFGDLHEFFSSGGNVFSDASCALDHARDRVVSDIQPLDVANHGGVVKTLALNYGSPAIGAGVAANCEATDARGLSRGANACDAGAYEVGGGDGKLNATGMSGLYFNAANNGHYVSIQKLYGDQSLVIWNTFDENGVPAWLYGVGTISGNHIHVPQVARNVGGKLHAGGAVDVSTPTLWGSFDVNLNDCYNATLTYNSPLPQFGNGSTTLQRLAFLDGVNCAR